MPMNGRDLTFYHNEEESSSAMTTCAGNFTVLAANFYLKLPVYIFDTVKQNPVTIFDLQFFETGYLPNKFSI